MIDHLIVIIHGITGFRYEDSVIMARMDQTICLQKQSFVNYMSILSLRVSIHILVSEAFRLPPKPLSYFVQGHSPPRPRLHHGLAHKSPKFATLLLILVSSTFSFT